MENVNMTEVMIFATTLSVILVVVMEIFKKTFPAYPNRFIPITAVIMGIVIGLLAFYFTSLVAYLRAWAGFFAGASSVGLFELGKKTVKSDK